MSSLSLAPVQIDAEGVYKYVLLKLRKRGGEEERYLVRGSADGEYHDDIYQAARRALAGDGHGTEYTLECAGGGRIEHVPSAGRIFVYGYSMGYGRANHEIAVALLREAYPTYANITYSNDGY